MAQRDASTNFDAAINGASIRESRVDAGMSSPRHGAAQSVCAPSSANGCISELSSDAIHGSAHDYNAAMKNYGVVYENYQSYLLPSEQLVAHDYDLAAKPVPDFSHIGCLNAELLDSTVQHDDVSDDDIENCGYMAWVHH